MEGKIKMKIAILLASYNGEKYIQEQIQSLLSQTYKDFKIYIRDDCSTDATYVIEKEFENRYPEYFQVIKRENGKSGSKYNFWELCKIGLESNAEYFMFCDQDDVWENNKVQITLDRMISVEKQNRDKPILVHSDLRVVDQNLNVLGESFISYRALNPEKTTINRLLVQNNVTGCTMMVNRALLEKAIDVDDVEKIAMHDWWFSIIASLFGEISFIDKSTINYRQHGNNVVGATKVNTIGFIIKRLTGSAHVRQTLHLSVLQAKAILDCYKEQIDADSLNTIRALADIEEYRKLKRVFIILKHRLLKQGPVQCVGQLMFV